MAFGVGRGQAEWREGGYGEAQTQAEGGSGEVGGGGGEASRDQYSFDMFTLTLLCPHLT